MKYNSLERYFSPLRLQKYLTHYSGNKKNALNLYRANLRLSQAFYPLLSVLEVSLRNAINEHFKGVFSDTDWLTNQTIGFMNDISLSSGPNPYLLRENVNRAKKKLQGSLTQGKLISELTFGTWTAFFDRKYYKVLKGEPIHIFSYLPKHIKRNNVYDKLNRIRFFRNRIYHYEPICLINSSFNLTQTESIYKEILEVLSWFSPDLIEWVSYVDFVEYEILRIKKLESFMFFAIYPLKVKYLYKKIVQLFKTEKIC